MKTRERVVSLAGRISIWLDRANPSLMLKSVNIDKEIAARQETTASQCARIYRKEGILFILPRDLLCFIDAMVHKNKHKTNKCVASIVEA